MPYHYTSTQQQSYTNAHIDISVLCGCTQQAIAALDTTAHYSRSQHNRSGQRTVHLVTVHCCPLHSSPNLTVSLVFLSFSVSYSLCPLSRPWLLASLMSSPLGSWPASEPVYHFRRPVFQRFSTRRFLYILLGWQLAFHLSLQVASIVLLAHRAAIRQLWPADSEPCTAWLLLEQMPAWLLARSVISVALSIRRLWLGDQWQSSKWEASWCMLVMWLSTGVMAGASLVALGSVQESEALPYCALWTVVAALLVVFGAHVIAFCSLHLFFPLGVLTVNVPCVPLAQHWYDSFATSPSKPTKHDGLTPQQLRAMPTSTCTTKRADSCCAVCMDDVEVGQEQRELKCGHAFHQPCIDPWLLKRRVCPLCVRAVSVVVPLATHSECVMELTQTVKLVRGSSSELEFRGEP